MKTVFLRVVDSDVEHKGAALRRAANDGSEDRYEVSPSAFSLVPKSPFSYWVSTGIRGMFESHQGLAEAGVQTAIGASTKNDFRYLRAAHEVNAGAIAHSRFDTSSAPWVLLSKGGEHSSFYYDPHLVVNWRNDGYELKADISEYRGSRGWGYQWSAALNGHAHYFRPGLTWPRRTQAGLSLRVMPAGGMFGDKGPALFLDGDEPDALLALCSVTNSSSFRALVSLQMAFGSYEVGVLRRTPIPKLTLDERTHLAALARRAWSTKRRLDCTNETSHSYVAPAALQVSGHSLAQRTKAWRAELNDSARLLHTIQAEVDEVCFDLYEIPASDRHGVAEEFGVGEFGQKPSTSQKQLAHEMLSWAVGVSFGRFDVRVNSNAVRSTEDEAPFAPLPACSPAMLVNQRGLPPAEPPADYPVSWPTDGILVDDPGHRSDLVGAVRNSLFSALGDDASALWHECGMLLGGKTGDLKRWFAKDFFPSHVKTYTLSRRKAPIYWQLATPSGSYSVWLYLHRFTQDTLFRVLNDCIGPKLDHEQLKLATMVSEAGPGASRSQRTAIAEQEAFVDELRAFKVEVELVAPLWSPDLNDGVVLNFSLLWRLVPHNKSWQKEIRKVWRSLMAGEYDWSSLAMHLWPERVVLNCLKDRSLAIAHGMEDTFWFQDDSGSWEKRPGAEAKAQRVITERTSRAVKAALAEFLTASGSAS